ncbi:hypothetical protein GMLC_36900 [Geomonas limicola]|uniref:Uncharacterized protein n=1 Tax=Geomonas limicola TaxID=2740186 RepID=A0A6V8NC61_9BACT|nr:hypothetical protein GMLC_36900 [Geomonas limicola]
MLKHLETTYAGPYWRGLASPLVPLNVSTAGDGGVSSLYIENMIRLPRNEANFSGVTPTVKVKGGVDEQP